MTAEIPARQITDWSSFHKVFATALGFARYYGRNNNAFLDILSAPQAPDVAADVPEGGLLVLHLDETTDGFRSRCPEQHQFLLEAASQLSSEALRLGEAGFIGNAYVTIAFS